MLNIYLPDENPVIVESSILAFTFEASKPEALI